MSELIAASVPARHTDAMPPVLPQPHTAPGVICERCKDRGWLRYDVPVGDARFGQITRCSCRIKAQVERERSLAFSECYTWLGDGAGDLARLTFDGFQWRNEYRSICQAYSTMKQLAGRFVRNEGELPNLLLIGPPGVGKTHLVASLLNQMRESGVACLYCTAQGLFNAFYAASFEDKPGLLNKAAGTAFLAIDELDKLHVSAKTDGKSYQQDMLFELLNKRYRAKLPTALITNEEQSLSKWLDTAALDRLGESCEWLRMSGTSYRQKGRAK